MADHGSLFSVQDIATRLGVTRRSVHPYQRDTAFPKPVVVRRGEPNGYSWAEVRDWAVCAGIYDDVTDSPIADRRPLMGTELLSTSYAADELELNANTLRAFLRLRADCPRPRTRIQRAYGWTEDDIEAVRDWRAQQPRRRVVA